MTGRHRVRVLRSVVVGGCVMAAGFVGAYASAAPVSSTTALPVLGSDTDDALFDLRAMTPGHVYRQCISIAVSSAVAADTVDFAARSVTGPLADHLDVTVDVGDGGSRSDRCAGFDTATATTVFDGTLRTLGNTTVRTGWHPAGKARRTFRISVSLADVPSASGKAAGADFVWSMVSHASDPDTPTKPTTPDDPSSPGDGSTLAPVDNTTGDLSGDPVAPQGDRTTINPDPTVSAGATSPGPATATTPAPSSTSPGGGRATGPSATSSPLGGGAGPTTPAATTPGRGSTGSSTAGATGSDHGGGAGSRSSDPVDLNLGRPLAAVRATVARAGRAIAQVATSPQYPLAAFALALGFLAVQDQIDRRDPKLALASRRQRDIDVEFPDIFGAVR